MLANDELSEILPTAKFLILLRTRVSSLSERFLMFSGRELTRFDVTNDSANKEYNKTICRKRKRHKAGIKIEKAGIYVWKKLICGLSKQIRHERS